MTEEEFKEMTKTEQVLTSMMKENTGRAMCDSGGTPKYDEDGNYVGSKQGYGRNWEANQNVTDFRKQEPYWLEVWSDEVMPLVNVFHYLNDIVEYSEEWDDKFNNMIEKHDPDNDFCWLECMERFPEWLEEEDHRVEKEFGTINTYNSECVLSQTLQFTTLTVDDYMIAGIQVHNGCDARGGYTKPRWFECDIYQLLSFNDISLGCDNCRSYWDSEDAGYSWYLDGNYSNDGYFKDCTFVEADLDEWFKFKDTFDQNAKNQKMLSGLDKDDFVESEFCKAFKEKYATEKERDLPIVLYEKNKVGDTIRRSKDTLVCPECGKGKLHLLHPSMVC